MKKLLIVGAGGFGREVQSLVREINQYAPTWDLLGYIDEWFAPGTPINDARVLGNMAFLNEYQEEINVILAFGSCAKLVESHQMITNPRVVFANLVHPATSIDPSLKLGTGNIITYGSFISCNVEIGHFNLLNTRISLGHDVRLGSFNILNPGVIISGGVRMGDSNFWGLGATCLQKISIGNGNSVGGASFLMTSIGDKATYFGVPARKMIVADPSK